MARYEFPMAKAGYLLNFSTPAGQGGDKQNFWRNIMGFSTPEELRSAILSEVTLDQLQPQGQNAYGDLYRAYIQLTGPSGQTRRIRTVWIVRFGEEIARFVTAVPVRASGDLSHRGDSSPS